MKMHRASALTPRIQDSLQGPISYKKLISNIMTQVADSKWGKEKPRKTSQKEAGLLKQQRKLASEQEMPRDKGGARRKTTQKGSSHAQCECTSEGHTRQRPTARKEKQLNPGDSDRAQPAARGGQTPLPVLPALHRTPPPRQQHKTSSARCSPDTYRHVLGSHSWAPALGQCAYTHELERRRVGKITGKAKRCRCVKTVFGTIFLRRRDGGHRRAASQALAAAEQDFPARARSRWSCWGIVRQSNLSCNSENAAASITGHRRNHVANGQEIPPNSPGSDKTLSGAAHSTLSLLLVKETPKSQTPTEAETVQHPAS
ncbi:unnamed protein product [Rangifer tarandus platyrhynchus]|uniref:Uncharacterized protein n=2 Tax=Rangifer tarandus platyrhynchus TaxID=3082113 RepID=A0ACB0DZC5_RANTA|nr:unnamed protein product [Rangifer tarandus platyrhynchus]CAI9693596.1 unnamed protein product [Rangifer tarandus platyrhynchus]